MPLMTYAVHDCDDPKEAFNLLMSWMRDYPNWLLGKKRCGGVVNYSSPDGLGRGFAIWKTAVTWHIQQQSRGIPNHGLQG